MGRFGFDRAGTHEEVDVGRFELADLAGQRTGGEVLTSRSTRILRYRGSAPHPCVERSEVEQLLALAQVLVGAGTENRAPLRFAQT